MSEKLRTKQRKPSYGRNGVPTPDGFEKYPERRHNGAWKKEDTARYKLEQMMKLTEKELLNIVQDESAPLFEKRLARAIKLGDWKELEGMMNQIYGTPRQITKIETDDTPIALVKFMEPKKNAKPKTKRSNR